MTNSSKAVEEIEFENFMLDRYIKRFNVKLDLHDERMKLSSRLILVKRPRLEPFVRVAIDHGLETSSQTELCG